MTDEAVDGTIAKGLEPIPKTHRVLKGYDLGVIWLAAAINIAYIFIASFILLPLAGFWNTIIAIIIGVSITGIPFALIGIIGVEKGITSMVSGRAAFGIRGSYFLSVINAITCIGFSALLTIISAVSLNLVTQSMFGYTNFVLMVSAISVIQWAFTLSGYKPYWKWLMNLMMVILTALMIVAMLVVLLDFNLMDKIASQTGLGLPLTAAIDIVIGAGPISWATYVSDYTRLSKASTRSSMGWVYLGFIPAVIWMMIIGVITGTVTNATDPSSIMAALGLGIPAVMIIILSAITANFLDIYSGSCSIMNLSPKLNLKVAVSIIAAFSWGLALVPGFTNNFEQFLYLVAYTLGPWVSIVLVDYFFINRNYDPHDLFKSEKMFWYTKGFNWRAIVSWVIGVTIFFTFEYVYPTLLNYSPAALPSLTVSAIIYYALSRKRRGQRNNANDLNNASLVNS
jgi:NCS1 family nucleobase:cation symporter-1